MQTYELLDKFEILFPLNDNITHLRRVCYNQELNSLLKLLDVDDDLRKAVTEQNIYSIFRLVEASDDLRKAVTEQHIYSIFRLVEASDDLRKAVTEQNIYSIFRLFETEKYKVNISFDDLRKAVTEQNIYSIFRLVEASDDLRKAVTEQNIYSIFRLVEASDDLRKAVTEQNIYSIFRLVEASDDLRKLVIDNNIWKLWPILKKYVDTQFTEAFRYFSSNKIEIDTDCFSRGQLQSKVWLIKELSYLNIDLGTVFLCAGWYGTLATMLFESKINLEKIRSFDIDPLTDEIAEVFNKPWVLDDWKFKAVNDDIKNINYDQHTYTVKRKDGTELDLTDSPDTIINTSCEHIENFSEWYNKIPKGKLVVLQSNNFFDINEHVNCYKTLEDFSNDVPMSIILYENELELENYKRFMIIGYK